MRMIVFSDSHRRLAPLEKIVAAHPEADGFIHLGDGERELDDLAALFPERAFYFVAGNCDLASAAPAHRVIPVGDVKVFATHGHGYGVKMGLGSALAAAAGAGAGVLLFGHTHRAVTGYADGIHYMNPGSVSQPAEGRPSYGVLDVTAAGVVVYTVAL